MRLTPFFLSLLLAGCAVPSRKSVTTHEHREFSGRPDGKTSEDIWVDREGGRGWFLLTDPKAESLSAIHNNQTALGGNSAFVSGPISVGIDPQAAAVVGAVGTAAGNVIGAAVKAAAK